jgi:transposase
MVGKHIDIGARVQALTLFEVKCPIPEITAISGVSKTSIYRIKQTALERGYNPEVCRTILASFVEDAPKSGRPCKATPDVEDLIIQTISKNSTTREYSQQIANSIAPTALVSASTVYRVLKRRGYRSSKPTYKPGLTAENKLARLKWCQDHKDWTLEDWKNVIWSDKTSITMGGQL